MARRLEFAKVEMALSPSLELDTAIALYSLVYAIINNNNNSNK